MLEVNYSTHSREDTQINTLIFHISAAALEIVLQLHTSCINIEVNVTLRLLYSELDAFESLEKLIQGRETPPPLPLKRKFKGPDDQT